MDSRGLFVGSFGLLGPMGGFAAWELSPIHPTTTITSLPGKPVAYNYGLLWIYYGLLWGIVALNKKEDAELRIHQWRPLGT